MLKSGLVTSLTITYELGVQRTARIVTLLGVEGSYKTYRVGQGLTETDSSYPYETHLNGIKKLEKQKN